MNAHLTRAKNPVMLRIKKHELLAALFNSNFDIAEPSDSFCIHDLENIFIEGFLVAFQKALSD